MIISLFKHILCLFRGHKFVKLVIPESWGDPRYEGKICKRCGWIKDLEETPRDAKIQDFG